MFSRHPGAQQAVDTLIMVQARDALGTAAAVADVALATVFVLILAALVGLLVQLRGIHGTVRDLAGRLERRLDPVFDRGRDVAANVEFITSALRTDVQKVSDSIRSLTERLQGASDRMEQRVEEFNALMEVVQSEAEDILLGSAAAVRGVRAGARSLRDGKADDEPSDEASALEPLDRMPEDEVGPPTPERQPQMADTGSVATGHAGSESRPGAAPGEAQASGSGDASGVGHRPGGV